MDILRDAVSSLRSPASRDRTQAPTVAGQVPAGQRPDTDDLADDVRTLASAHAAAAAAGSVDASLATSTAHFAARFLAALETGLIGRRAR